MAEKIASLAKATRKELLEAVRKGVPVATFILEAAVYQAEQLMARETATWVLTEAEAHRVAAMLAHPPEPTAYAVESAKLVAQHVEIRS